MANLLFDESASNSETSKGFGWWFSGDTFERNAYEERNPHSRSLSYRLTPHPVVSPSSTSSRSSQSRLHCCACRSPPSPAKRPRSRLRSSPRFPLFPPAASRW